LQNADARLPDVDETFVGNSSRFLGLVSSASFCQQARARRRKIILRQVEPSLPI
jgi:hypothetical protein